MEKTVLSAIERFSLIPKGSHVTVALSGGADSMALLHVLADLRDSLAMTLSAAHYNHGIRGAEADRDEQFVKTVCERMAIPLICEKGDVPALAKQEKIGLELAARKARYDFLDRVAPDLIATAHTASDNLETVLMNLTRGSGLQGLCGIPAKRGRIIRPLITSTREEVEEFCRQREIAFVTDSTNLSENYTRNKLRHRVVPVLKDINPSVAETVCRAGLCLTEDEAALSGMAQEYLTAHLRDGALTLDGFSDLPAAVRRRVVRQYVERTVPGLFLDYMHTQETVRICLQNGRTGLPGDFYAVAGGGKLTLQPVRLQTEYRVETRELTREEFEKNAKIHNLLFNHAADCDKIIGKTVLRTREAGDRIRLAGSGCTKTLKKLYLEKRVPLVLRETLPVMADEEGVFWIYGIGVAARCAVTKKTERVWMIDAHEV